MTKIYMGRRTSGGVAVSVSDEGGARALDPRLDIVNHSPHGFEWGYGGSAPAQLALALCADVLNDDRRAERAHQRVKRLLVENLSADDWRMSEDQVRAAIACAEVGGA